MSIERSTRRQAAIVMKPGVMGGSPIVEGTRVRVSDIVRYKRLGTNVLAALPFLGQDQMDAAFAYYEQNRATIDSEITEEDQLTG